VLQIIIISAFVEAEVLAVCWSGVVRCVLTQYQGGKNICNALKEKTLLPPSNLGNCKKTLRAPSQTAGLSEHVK